jgi:hypothetical protein
MVSVPCEYKLLNLLKKTGSGSGEGQTFFLFIAAKLEQYSRRLVYVSVW